MRWSWVLSLTRYQTSIRPGEGTDPFGEAPEPWKKRSGRTIKCAGEGFTDTLKLVPLKVLLLEEAVFRVPS